MIFESKLTTFLPQIKSLQAKHPLEKSTLLNDLFLLKHEQQLRMYYAPHNEFIHTEAKVIIVGITPGWQQTKVAYARVLQGLSQNETKYELLQHAKIAAGFSGQMRRNLCNMLDQIGLADIFDLPSTTSMFESKRPILHTTSVIRYPVFWNGKNYTGHSPNIGQSKLLKESAYDVFPRELSHIHHPALIIPLGKAVEAVIRQLRTTERHLQKHTILFGFPHPSGANGHRLKQLQQHQRVLQQMVHEFAQKNNLPFQS
ncbi:uracil-DNA glycosylase family protein [Ornithinibacillus gellani]|uniref:uracil-DNA glycosylase family protein n=1 Tax=Ornithinibacillus gellani TaxID=2293253 RepID=UPI001681319F|nr:hypothetical protein [Ornithinibacillus gellani]